MATIDHVYLDAGLTDQFDDAADTLDAFALNGESGDGVFYVGIPDAAASPTRKIQDATNPGVDNIVVSIADSAPGSGVEASHIKLALTSAGLDSAVAGDPLNLGATIQSKPANAVPVHYRWTNSTGSGTSTEISLSVSDRIESDI